jgi:hypothetical protein
VRARSPVVTTRKLVSGSSSATARSSSKSR